MRKLLLILSILSLFLVSCAGDETLTLNGKTRTFEPYGWADKDLVKNDSIIYTVSVGNIVWSAIFVETIFVPIWLTGWYLWEPTAVKTEYIIKPLTHLDSLNKGLISVDSLYYRIE